MVSTLPFLFYWLNRVPVNVEKVLDLGIGRGIAGAMLQLYREPRVLHGVEIHQSYADAASKYYHRVTVADAVDAVKQIPDKSYDAVICFEMIEHLSKERGRELLDNMERIGKAVYVSTPSRFFPQVEYDENVHQRHLSLWTAKEFRARGYQVRGFGRAQWWLGLIPAVLTPRLCDNVFAWKVDAA